MICLSFEIPLGGVSGWLALRREHRRVTATERGREPCRHTALVSPWLMMAASPCGDALVNGEHDSAASTCERCGRSFSAAELRALRRQGADRLRREFGF